MHAYSLPFDTRSALAPGLGAPRPCTFPPERQMTEETIPMKAIVVTDQAAGTAGMKLVERPEPRPALNDVVVRVHASGFVPTEMARPSTWTDRPDRDRTPSIPGHAPAAVGAHVIGTGRAADRQKALDFGAQEFVDLDSGTLEDVGSVDLVFDVIGGDIGKRSARLIRPGGTLVSIVGPSEARPVDGLAIDFVVESDRAQLSEIVQRMRDGRLRTNIGTVAPLDDAVAAFNSTARRPGKTVIRVRP